MLSPIPAACATLCTARKPAYSPTRTAIVLRDFNKPHPAGCMPVYSSSEFVGDQLFEIFWNSPGTIFESSMSVPGSNPRSNAAPYTNGLKVDPICRFDKTAREYLLWA